MPSYHQLIFALLTCVLFSHMGVFASWDFLIVLFISFTFNSVSITTSIWKRLVFPVHRAPKLTSCSVCAISYVLLPQICIALFDGNDHSLL